MSRTAHEGIAVAQQSRPELRKCKVHDVGGVGISFAAGCAGAIDACHVDNSAAARHPRRRGRHPDRDRAGQAGGVAAATAASTTCSSDLDGMVGLPGVKAEVHAVVDEIQVNEWRRKARACRSARSATT